MNFLTQLEQRYGFRYPALYHRLWQDGFLDWGAFGPQWFTNVFPGLQHQPPFLLYAPDFEPLPPEQIAEFLAVQHDADEFYAPVRQDYRFVPFGQNGAGDYYAFFYAQTAEADAEPPVVLWWHDDNRADVLAANLQDFTLRAMAEAVSDMPADSLLMQGDWQQNLAAWRQSHRGYLKADHDALLGQLYQGALQNRKDETTGQSSPGLISPTALRQLLQTAIGFDAWGTHFAYEAEQTANRPVPVLLPFRGQYCVQIAPVPSASSPVYAALKALNWKPNRQAQGCLEYQRGLDVLLRPDDAADIAARAAEYSAAYRERLDALKAFEGVRVFFRHGDTDTVVDL